MIYIEYTYILAYDVGTLTTGIYNTIGELQSDDVQPVIDSITPEQALELVRIERNRRLSECDWTQLVDVALTSAQVTRWRIYRQELRDMMDGFAWNRTTWPTPPSNPDV